MKCGSCRRSVLIGLVSLIASSRSEFARGGQETAESKSVVLSLLDAMRRNDGAGIRAAFAATASQAYGDAAPKTGQAFFRWLQTDIIEANGRVDDPRLTVSGDEVVVRGQYRNSAGYSKAADFLFKVTDGRIVSWRMRY